VSDNRLESPSFAVAATNAQISFKHRWNTETGYDGGVLEISIGGGAFADIVTAGGSFAAGAHKIEARGTPDYSRGSVRNLRR
jgi:hypothetical protein